MSSRVLATTTTPSLFICAIIPFITGPPIYYQQGYYLQCTMLWFCPKIVHLFFQEWLNFNILYHTTQHEDSRRTDFWQMSISEADYS